MTEHYIVLKWESRFTLWLNAAKITNYIRSTLTKVRLYQKIVQIKVVENLLSYKKVNGRTCLSLPGVELGVRKIDMFLILYCTEMGK